MCDSHPPTLKTMDESTNPLPVLSTCSSMHRLRVLLTVGESANCEQLLPALGCPHSIPFASLHVTNLFQDLPSVLGHCPGNLPGSYYSCPKHIGQDTPKGRLMLNHLVPFVKLYFPPLISHGTHC